MVTMGSSSALMVVYALSSETMSRGVHLLRFAEQPLIVNIGIIHKKNVQMNSIELFKGLCLDLRGPTVANITIENAHLAPFSQH